METLKLEEKMGIFIDQIRIENFRAIQKLELTLSPFTVLVGANNSGKTTFLRALHLALGEGRKSIAKEDFHISNGVVAKEIVIDVRIVPVDTNYKRISKFDQPWFPGVFVESQVINDESGLEYIALRTRIALDTRKSGGASLERTYLKKWDVFEDWSDSTLESEKAPLIDAIPLYFIDAQRDILQDLREKNSFLGRLSSRIQFDKEKVRKIEQLLANLNSEIVDASPVLKHLSEKLSELNETIGSKKTSIEITPVHKKIRDIGKGLNIHLAEGTTESLPLDYHGMGTRSWASLLTIKAFVSWEFLESQKEDEPFHPILALEEPESHLHPNAQRHLFVQMEQMEGQKIMSTHSPFIAARSRLVDIRHFYKTNAGTVIGTIDSSLEQSNLEKIEREIMNTRGELLFAKCVVLCEGLTEEQMFSVFAKAHWGASHFERGICFIGVGSGTNYEVFISFCRSFNIPWFILGDSEPAIVKRLEAVLAKLTLPDISNSANIVLLPNGKKIETYLVAEGYQSNLKKAILEFQKNDCPDERSYRAKQKEVEKITEERVLQFLKSMKTKIAPYVANAIVQDSDPKKRIPKAFLQIFQKVDNVLKTEKTTV